MNELLTVINERVDDIPLLQAQRQHMGLPSLLDEHFPTHGNWQGRSLGWVTATWLTHILSEGDHRLHHVEPWVEKRLGTLQGSTEQPVQVLDFTDDRLESVRLALRADPRWEAFESALHGQVLRVYALQPERVHVESTSASGYWTVTEDGLFQFGHRKDHRPDLPQVKVMQAVLDPLGMPLATDVVSGERAARGFRRVWAGMGGCTWGIARWPPGRRGPFCRRRGISPCVRCQRCNYLLKSWKPSCTLCGLGSNPSRPCTGSGSPGHRN